MRQPQTNICPLLAITSINTSGNPSVCIEERCAWWRTEYAVNGVAIGECAIVSVAGSLSSMSDDGLTCFIVN